jgi:hypothetical protein
MKISTRVMSAATAGLLVLGVAPIALAAPPPVAPPPSPTQIAAATNAMLGFDLPAILDNATGPLAGYSTGYTNPPGGQDPLPICVYGEMYRNVSVPGTLAVGFMARNGYVSQSVYEYPSPTAADRAWSRLDRDIAARCGGSWTSDGSRVTITRSRLAATASAGAGWLVTTTGLGSVTAVAVRPVGDAIQVVSYQRQAASLSPRVPPAIATLSTALADRWARRDALPNTQGALLTTAALAALTPADVPATLPITSPADGGWSMFSADSPGDGPYTCTASPSRSRGSWGVVTDLGGSGDVIASPGSLMQDVEVYQSNDAARAAWTALRRAVLGCNDPAGNPWAVGGTGTRTVSGVSELAFEGVPGVWSREFTVYRDLPLSGKSYSVSLLSGNVIQTLSYYTTVDRVSQIPLDQVAVNALAVTLLTRWNATMAAQVSTG